MNQAVTGTFIANARKKKGFTRRQLADELNISDKTVSKWETGNGFPEISLMLPLCAALDVSVNELLTGEYLTETQYKEKAEANMVDMIREKQENARKIKTAYMAGLSSTISFVTILAVAEFYGKYMQAQTYRLLVVIAWVVFALGMYVVAQGERTIGYYRCKNCAEYFTPTAARYLAGPHMFSARVLRCPTCKKITWCKKVLSKPDTAESEAN